MSRRKKLGVVLIATCAVAAMGASPAVAQPVITADSYPAFLHGTQLGTFYFTTPGGTITCNTGTYTGTLNEPGSSSFTLAPNFQLCSWGLGTATVTMNGCDYGFQVKEKLAEDEYGGTFGISCPTGSEIKIHMYGKVPHEVPLCTIAISAQSGLGPVYYYNNKSGPLQTVGGIHYGVSGMFCASNTYSNGVQHSAAALTAEDAHGKPIGVDFGGE